MRSSSDGLEEGRKTAGREREIYLLGAEPYRDIYQIQPPIPAWQFTSSCWKKGFPRTWQLQFSNQILHIIQARVVNIFPGNPKSYSKFGSNHQNWDLNSANLITSEKTFKRSVKALYARSLCVEYVVNQDSSVSILTYNLSKQHQKLPIWRLPKHLLFFPNLSPPCSNQYKSLKE